MIGNRIKILREEKGINQEELAKNISVSTSTIGMYETGRREPNHEITLKLANYFNVTTDYLLGKTNEKNITKSQQSLDKTIDINGLSDEEILELKKQIEYMKWKKQEK